MRQHRLVAMSAKGSGKQHTSLLFISYDERGTTLTGYFVVQLASQFKLDTCVAHFSPVLSTVSTLESSAKRKAAQLVLGTELESAIHATIPLTLIKRIQKKIKLYIMSEISELLVLSNCAIN